MLSGRHLVRKYLSTTKLKFLRRTKRSVNISKYSTQSDKLVLSHSVGSNDFEIIDQNFGQALEEIEQKFSDRVLVHSVEQGVQLTYGETLRKADRLAAGLLTLGLQKGDRVAIWAPNSWEWIVVKFALARAGLIAVAMNPLIVGEDAVHCLSLTKISAVVAFAQHKNSKCLEILEQFAPELRDAKPGAAKCPRFPHLKAAICMGGKTPEFAVSIEELAASSSESDIASIKKLQADISPEDPVMFPFSSGTTGKPKAVVISHKSYVNNARVIAQSLRHDKNKPVVYCVQVPLFHAFGIVAVLGANAHLGGKLVLPSTSYSPKAHLRAISEQKCSVLTGTPTMYLDTLRASETEGQPTHEPELAICGGAPLVPQLGEDIMKGLKAKRLHAIYGLSEDTCVAFVSSPDCTPEDTCHTVGKVTPRCEVKVVDRNGETVPVNTPGELWIRGYQVMKGYFDQAKATKETITPDGWLKTGDQFVIDENGRAKVIGRYKDIIIRGGENINPKEVEDVLTTHPAIIDAQVVGVKDDRLGEELCACLIVRDSFRRNMITEICQNKIAKFKIPRYYVILDEYPRTTTGKIQKHKIREMCNNIVGEGKLSAVNA